MIEELLYIKQNGSLTRPIVEKVCHTSAATAERDISYLKKRDLLTFEGPHKMNGYVLTHKGKQLMLEEME